MLGSVVRRPLGAAVTACALLVPAGAAVAAPPPDGSRYQKVQLVDHSDLTQPMRMQVAPDGRVVFIERDGRVRVWSPSTQSTVTAGTVAVRVTGEIGLVGLALAPDFAQTGHLYLHFSRPDWTTSYMARVSRFTLTAGSVLDPASEVVIMDIQHPQGVGGGHSAGDMRMTPDGDLFINTGDNTNCCASRGFPGMDERPGQGAADAQKTAANSNDLNGKVLRIHPLAQGGYSIPSGNLFPEGTPKTRPEVFAMGLRNPFTIGDWDPATRTLWMADYGPDAVLADPLRGPAGHVRMFLMKQPGMYGWPYCTMNNVAYDDWNYVEDKPGPWFDCARLVNDSPNNTGIQQLPPAIPANLYWTYSPQSYFPTLYGGGAMAGPRYVYDPANASKTKFPEWFDGRRFLYDWTTNWVQTTRFADDLFTATDLTRFAPDLSFSKPMDMEFGPDGALYVLEYGNGWGTMNDDSGVFRIDYVDGNRKPSARATQDRNSGALPLTVAFDASGSSDPDGDAITYAWDLDGDGTTDASGAKPSHTYAAAGNFHPRVTVTDARGESALVNLTVTAGNTRPAVKIETPLDGTFAEFGDNIPFKVSVVDPEDGAIDCTKVKVSYSLGHNEHAHPMAEATPNASCEGVLVPGRDAAHGNAYVYHVVQATYTDKGGAGDTRSLTGEDGLVMHPRAYAASTYPVGDGVGLYSGQLFVPGSGHWFKFPRIDVKDVKRINVSFATRQAGVSFTIRADSPTGPVVARIENIPNTGSTSLSSRVYRYLTASTVTDPGGPHDLYFVSEWAEGLQPELFVQNIHFVTGEPTTVSATVNPAAPNGANGWYRSNPQVTIRSDQPSALFPGQVSVDGGQTWTTANAGGQSTIGRQGRNTVLYRAADAAGNAAAGLGGTLSLDVDSVAPAIAATDPVFLQGHAATPAWTCTDATSGVASCTASAIDTSTPGTRSFTITATDNAGLATTVTRSYTVLPATSVQGDVGGTVPATLALTLGGPASFGAFAPGVEMTYEATATAKVVSTAGDATLSVSGPARLANGAFVLPQPLQVAGVPKAWSAPVSNEPVALTFRQPIGATDALRTGTYSTTLVFTLSSTAP